MGKRTDDKEKGIANNSLSEEYADDDLLDDRESIIDDESDWDEAIEYNEEGFSRQDVVDGIGSLLGGMRSLSSSALKLARNRTVDSAAKIINGSPEQLERMAKAGRSLQDIRNVAGMSVEDVAGAIDLKNPDLLKAVEDGKAGLPFEILLRLSSFYARNNPVPFILKYARTYNPLVSKTLERIGIDRLVIEAEREIQFIQIIRSRDEARALSDEDFERVLAFTEQAFQMALHFSSSEESVNHTPEQE